MENKRKRNMVLFVIMLLDLLLVTGCGVISVWTRFDFHFFLIPMDMKLTMLVFVCVQGIVFVTIFLLRRMYDYVWRLVNVYDVMGMVVSVATAFCVSVVACRLLGTQTIYGNEIKFLPPLSIVFIDLVCLMAILVGMRCSLRVYESISRFIKGASRAKERIMIIGAGESGRLLLREISINRASTDRVCCFVDDNPNKTSKKLSGVPIYIGRGNIPALARKYDITQIVFAIPSAKASDKKEILSICQQTGCKVMTLPSIYNTVKNGITLSDVKKIQPEDLLGRDPVKLNKEKLDGFINGRVVLVTGGGGSIGSELCRQVAEHSPKQLVVLDVYENNAYDLQQHIRSIHPQLDLKIEIASVRDKESIYSIFEKYTPDIVLHAAAHKHVPLMEDCPQEAVKNNIFGTYHVVRAAETYKTKKVVMISTDKAVNPTNFMGATKRFCEMIMQSRTASETEFCAVRFGNVLGSNGSVVPLFKRQIEKGGPVTITDKRIIRYFMTIPEAAQLVLEAGAMAKPGQVFVLDMGEPVKILTLAENLIRMSGYEPYKDIEIREVGLRPGEKLYEELLVASEKLEKTPNEKIFVEKEECIDPAIIEEYLERLGKALSDNISPSEMRALLKEMVTTYVEPEVINAEAVLN